VEFAYLTGWRLKSEVLALQWWQVDFDGGMVRLEPGSTKNADGRVFPFAALPALAGLLRTQADRTRAIERASGSIIPWVFHRAAGRSSTSAGRGSGPAGWPASPVGYPMTSAAPRSGTWSGPACPVRGHEAHRAQDGEYLPAVRHCGRSRT